MPEETVVSQDKLVLLSSKIEREARFTRVLVVVCMLASVGVSIFSFTQIINILPQLVVVQHMGNLDKMYDMWKGYDARRWQKEKAPTTPTTPATPTAPAK